MRASAVRGVLAGTTVGLLAFAGVASAAFWTTDQLRVPVRVGAAVVVADASATVEGPLFPGELNDVRITFTNPHPVPTQVSEVTVARFTGDPALVPHLVAGPALGPGGVDPVTGAPRALVLPAGGSATVTLPDAVGLALDTPDAVTGGGPVPGAQADVILRATYAAVPGDETGRLDGPATPRR
jgi:hypothetical protein